MLAASLGFFLLRNPLVRWIRSGSLRYPAASLASFPKQGWFICLTLSALGCIPLVLLHRWALGGLFLVGLAALVVEAISQKSDPRSRMLTEVVHSLTAALLAPATAYAATGVLGWKGLTLWMLCSVYFALTTLDVRWRIAQLYRDRGLMTSERLIQAARERRIAICVGSILVLIYFLLAPVQRMVIFAFLPLMYRIMRKAVVPSVLAVGIRQLGWQEVRLSLVFVVLSAALVRYT
jgi:4-hydroxybenzoate polyprenyltransferase